MYHPVQNVLTSPTSQNHGFHRLAQIYLVWADLDKTFSYPCNQSNLRLN